MAVKGSRETAAALRELSRYVSTPMGTASRFALQPTLKAAKSNAKAIPFKEDTGALEESMTIKKASDSKPLNQKYQVGPDASYEKQTPYGIRKPVKYAHLDEFGTAPHYQPGRGVVHPGQRPTPFLTPAYFETREQVPKRFGDKLGPALEKRAAQLAAKQRK